MERKSYFLFIGLCKMLSLHAFDNTSFTLQPNSIYTPQQFDTNHEHHTISGDFTVNQANIEESCLALKKWINDKKLDQLYHCCAQTKMTWQALTLHVRQWHKNKGMCSCPECGYATSNNTYMYEHIAVNHNNLPLFVCPLCNKNNQYSKSLQTHFEKCFKKKFLKNSTDIEDVNSGQLVAEPVEKGFTTQAMHTVDRKIAAISCCAKPLGNWYPALNHISLCHKLSRIKFMCPQCKHVHKNQGSALECYVRDIDETIFDCFSCNNRFDTRAELAQHAALCRDVLHNSNTEQAIVSQTNETSLATQQATDVQVYLEYYSHFDMEIERHIGFCDPYQSHIPVDFAQSPYDNSQVYLDFN
ncbi:hypothetical protein Noda2021_06950 [Candidatus Dependentiae bacterium Noda2021]|nr:hypothetical protein Noda2021_06950 [Candidatus Dependentiae bacterium Noda2021]